MKLAKKNIDFKMPELATKLKQTNEVTDLNEFVIDWIEHADQEIQPHLIWQLLATPKYFRPITIFSCYKSVNGQKITETVLRSAVALELIHNVTLIIDDILDRSRYRRGKLSLHCKFGLLPALMVSGYLFSGAIKIVSDDSYSTELLSSLVQRLGIAECIQWRLRRNPLGVEDWRLIAAEDTGCMFETCARLGSRDAKLQKFGNLLGMLYHGCDDVADVRGDSKLGGTGNEDIRDGILTLPAAIAIRNMEVAALFRDNNPENIPLLKKRCFEALNDAEIYLDTIAEETKKEALENANDPTDLLELISRTRELSGGK